MTVGQLGNHERQRVQRSVDTVAFGRRRRFRAGEVHERKDRIVR